MNLQKLPPRKLRDRGLGVTVCIAAICESLQKIVTVCDEMITFGDVSVDGTAEKAAPVHTNWFTLYAANDITDVRPIIEGTMLLLCSNERQKSLLEAGQWLSTSFAKRNDELVNYNVFRPNGFTGMDDFYERGKKILSRADFIRIRREALATKPECVVLMGGFDFAGIGHLILQEPVSPFQCYDDPDFWAIGSGQHEAISAMLFHADKLRFSINNSEAECMYHLLAAKFMAESNKLVGRKTFASVHSFNQNPRHLSESHIATIRSAWERSFIPTLPRTVIKRIQDMLPLSDFVRPASEQLRILPRKNSTTK